jgi:apolipoprotein D and lipocalin family protein
MLAWWIILLVVVCALLLLWALIAWWTWRRLRFVNPTMPRVPIDPHEYQGTWYEIARYPQWFEKGCTHVTATYIPEANRIRVVNRCTRHGKPTESSGWAYPTSHEGVLGVSFFPGIYGNYTVTYRDPTTSIVTDPQRKSLWILSRHKTLTKNKEKQIWQWLRDHDFDTDPLITP